MAVNIRKGRDTRATVHIIDLHTKFKWKLIVALTNSTQVWMKTKTAFMQNKQASLKSVKGLVIKIIMVIINSETNAIRIINSNAFFLSQLHVHKFANYFEHLISCITNKFRKHAYQLNHHFIIRK